VSFYFQRILFAIIEKALVALDCTHLTTLFKLKGDSTIGSLADQAWSFGTSILISYLVPFGVAQDATTVANGQSPQLILQMAMQAGSSRDYE
jgi:hypothetical protein